MDTHNGYRLLLLMLLGLLGVVCCLVIANYMQGLPTDWELALRPATLAYFQDGRDPYAHDQYGWRFFNPPWVLYVILPFALLPPLWGRALWMLVSAGAFMYMAKKMGVKPWAIFLVFLSPPILDCMIDGQLEWLVLLGAFVPLPWGLPLLLIKPQVGIVLAAWQFWRSKRKLECLLLLVVLSVWSFLCFGFWPLRMLEPAQDTFLWPCLLPVGAVLVYKAFKDKDLRCAFMAAPCLSPHAWPYSFAGVVLVVADDPVLLVVMLVAMWAVMILYPFSLLGV